jgi:hypothetical protein
MPFLAEEHIVIPTTDLLSWMFDKQTYNADDPVGHMKHKINVLNLNIADLR